MSAVGLELAFVLKCKDFFCVDQVLCEFLTLLKSVMSRNKEKETTQRYRRLYSIFRTEDGAVLRLVLILF
jgi:hypothetical protein